MDSEKTTFKYSPCKPSIDCSAYADDEYDPCEKTQDITDKDIAVLSKEEKRKKTEQAEEKIKEDKNQIKTGEKVKDDKNQIKTGEKVKDDKNQIKTGENVKDDKNQIKTKEQIKAGDKRGRMEVKTEDSSKAEAMGDYSTEKGEKNKTGNCKKKRNCRKVKRNPFFTNRLNFSSDLPLRPATPPPQFFPPVEDENVKRCAKRKKKCLRRQRDEKYGDGRGSKGGGSSKDGRSNKEGRSSKEGRDSKEGRNSKEGRSSEDGRSSKEGRSSPEGRSSKDGKSSKDEQGGQSGLDELDELDELDGLDEVDNKDDKDGQHGDDEGKNKDLCVCPDGDMEACDPTTCLTGDSEDYKYRRKCSKKKFRPPCRKRGSDISISLQPRKIPALQRDLPERCPKEEAINERKLPLLCIVDCLTKNCTKKTKKSF